MSFNLSEHLMDESGQQRPSGEIAADLLQHLGKESDLDTILADPYSVANVLDDVRERLNTGDIIDVESGADTECGETLGEIVDGMRARAELGLKGWLLKVGGLEHVRDLNSDDVQHLNAIPERYVEAIGIKKLLGQGGGIIKMVARLANDVDEAGVSKTMEFAIKLGIFDLDPDKRALALAHLLCVRDNFDLDGSVVNCVSARISGIDLLSWLVSICKSGICEERYLAIEKSANNSLQSMPPLDLACFQKMSDNVFAAACDFGAHKIPRNVLHTTCLLSGEQLEYLGGFEKLVGQSDDYLGTVFQVGLSKFPVDRLRLFGGLLGTNLGEKSLHTLGVDAQKYAKRMTTRDWKPVFELGKIPVEYIDAMGGWDAVVASMAASNENSRGVTNLLTNLRQRGISPQRIKEVVEAGLAVRVGDFGAEMSDEAWRLAGFTFYKRNEDVASASKFVRILRQVEVSDSVIEKLAHELCPHKLCLLFAKGLLGKLRPEIISGLDDEMIEQMNTVRVFDGDLENLADIDDLKTRLAKKMKAREKYSKDGLRAVL